MSGAPLATELFVGDFSVPVLATESPSAASIRSFFNLFSVLAIFSTLIFHYWNCTNLPKKKIAFVLLPNVRRTLKRFFQDGGWDVTSFVAVRIDQANKKN